MPASLPVIRNGLHIVKDQQVKLLLNDIISNISLMKTTFTDSGLFFGFLMLIDLIKFLIVNYLSAV